MFIIVIIIIFMAVSVAAAIVFVYNIDRRLRKFEDLDEEIKKQIDATVQKLTYNNAFEQCQDCRHKGKQSPEILFCRFDRNWRTIESLKELRHCAAQYKK